MKAVTYFRVSTQKQGKSGLGLEAQQSAVESFLIQMGAEVIGKRFIEVESGKRDDRPELKKAILTAKRSKGTLVIAKLDRLSRDPDFLGQLMKEGVDFVACDMPSANKFTIRIMAAVAEQEREAISDRTKKALAAYKARGGLLGAARPECRNLTPEAMAKGTQLAAQARQKKADEAYTDLYPILQEKRSAGQSLQEIADSLNAEGYTTRRGKPWNRMQVKLVLDRAEKLAQ